jgi:hypothetical protein
MIKIEYPTGSYHWNNTQSFNKEEFKDLNEWDRWKIQKNVEFLKSFNLNDGDNVIITVGGKTGNIITWKGVFKEISGNFNYGYFVKLQQKEKLNVIDGWRVIDIIKAF